MGGGNTTHFYVCKKTLVNGNKIKVQNMYKKVRKKIKKCYRKY